MFIFANYEKKKHSIFNLRKFAFSTWTKLVVVQENPKAFQTMFLNLLSTGSWTTYLTSFKSSTFYQKAWLRLWQDLGNLVATLCLFFHCPLPSCWKIIYSINCFWRLETGLASFPSFMPCKTAMENQRYICQTHLSREKECQWKNLTCSIRGLQYRQLYYQRNEK